MILSTISSTTEKWFSLREAAQFLGVHLTTLRRWADNGDIPVLLTPGGHRRFAASDLAHFAQERRSLQKTSSIEQVWADQAMTRTRTEITVQRSQQWLNQLDDMTRSRHRLLGQRLMGLTLQYLSNETDGQHLLEEARKIGQEYGRISLESHLSLTDALQASMFFRDMLVETALHLPENVRIQPEANTRLLRRINTLMNTVHLAVAEVYDAHYGHTLPGA